MSTMYSTGPILIYVGPQIIRPTAYTPTPPAGIKFLGTAEQTPQAENRRQYQPAYNDLGGAVPFDLNFLGEDMIFAVDLTRWNESVYGVISTAPQQMGGVPTPGGIPLRGTYSSLNALGSLQAHDGNTITVYAVFPYGFPTAAPNAAGRAFGMPLGYRMHGGSLINDKHHQWGSKYRKLHLTFQFTPIHDHATFDNRLYDHIVPTALARPPASPTGLAA